MTCEDCVHDKVCVIKAFPDAFENTQWEKDPCDHFAKASGWISVDERLPSEFVSVLGCMADAGDFPPVRECYRVGNVFYFPAIHDRQTVSHWMPLPEAPKGE